MDGSERPLTIWVPPAERLSEVWEKIKPWVDECVAYTAGCYESIDLYRSILNGDARLWLVMENEKPLAFLMTKLEKHPRRWLLGVPFIGGVRLTEWAKLVLDYLVPYAKMLGCDGLSGGGREGWARVAGFKKVGLWLVKDI